MERNNFLNLFKGIAIFGVVFIHVTFPGIMGIIIKYMSLWAVPLFIMTAGYYSFGCEYAKIRARFVKIIRILIFGYIVYLVYRLIAASANDGILLFFINNFNWKTPILFVVFCTIKWAIPLWYLIAMIETYLLWMYVIKKNIQETVIKYVWILFLAGALLTIYVESANLNWSYKTNFLFRAFPWFVLGYATKMRCEEYIKRISNYTLCFFICIGWGITISSVVNKIYIDYSYIGVLITAPAMFALCVKNRSINVPTPLSYIGDKLTMYIYILHVPISYFVKKLAKMTSIDSLVGYEYIYPLIVLCASIVVSLFVYHIRKSIKSSL